MIKFKRFIKTIFGIDPVLLDVQARTERLEATIDGDVDWMLICKPIRKGDLGYVGEIKCDDGNDYYRKMRKKNGD